MRIWSITPLTVYRQAFLDVGLPDAIRVYTLPPVVNYADGISRFVVAPDNLVDIGAQTNLLIDVRTVRVTREESRPGLFEFYPPVEDADVTLSVQRASPAGRTAAQDMKRPVTESIPRNYRDRPAEKCVICGRKMKPRRGKFCCSDKCRQAKKRGQIPVETEAK